MSTYPDLPPEQPLSDLEQIFIHESPPNLWPENQDSILGTLRRALTRPGQQISDELEQMFVEMFAPTADVWLYKHETDLGIPRETASLTTEQRRGRLLLHQRRGAFTRTNREYIVEFFITASQSAGDPTAITPEGIILSAGGVTLYNEPVPGNISGLYDIVENVTGFSYAVNISPLVTPDLEALTRELRHFTPAGISFTLSAVISYVYRALNIGQPKLYLRMAESAGTVATDSSGNGNNGTYNGSPVMDVGGALPSQPWPADRGKVFDGSNDYISIPHAASLNLGDTLTMVAWVKRDGANVVNNAIIDKRSNAYQMRFSGGGGVSPIFHQANAGDILTTTWQIPNDSIYHLIVMTKDGSDASKCKIYVDGVDVSGTFTNRTLVNNTNQLDIGRLDAASFARCSMDEVALYNYCMTYEQQKALYDAR